MARYSRRPIYLGLIFQLLIGLSIWERIFGRTYKLRGVLRGFYDVPTSNQSTTEERYQDVKEIF